MLQREADAAHVRQRPGGVFPLQFPLAARLPRVRTAHPLPAQPLGRHEYGGRMVLSADAGRLRTRFDNWLRDVTGVLREHTETFWMWPASRDDNAAELASTDSPRCPTQAIPRC